MVKRFETWRHQYRVAVAAAIIAFVVGCYAVANLVTGLDEMIASFADKCVTYQTDDPDYVDVRCRAHHEHAAEDALVRLVVEGAVVAWLTKPLWKAAA